MPRVLAEALEQRGRKWGERNREMLRLLRAEKLPTRHYPSRPQLSIGQNAFLTRIQRAP